ncbi:unnamed protein product [Lactuca saligna]|uniref:Uncharacterized protein n=1 Tax=Lactuca saligna TaxID=75948 RepID=A0AA35YN82_LACSI|nr:unnamed protein product [Lactuca saligna]
MCLEIWSITLYMKMLNAPTVGNMVSYSVLTPYVLYSKEELYKENEDGSSLVSKSIFEYTVGKGLFQGFQKYVFRNCLTTGRPPKRRSKFGQNHRKNQSPESLAGEEGVTSSLTRVSESFSLAPEVP